MSRGLLSTNQTFFANEAIVLVFRKQVTIEYTSEPISILSFPKIGKLYKDDHFLEFFVDSEIFKLLKHVKPVKAAQKIANHLV